MPWPAIIAGAANVAGAVGSYLSNRRAAKTARRNTDRTIQANREMAEYAYSKDLEMWERQNMYNRPSAQMERFKDAGLNPNLIYGQGTPGQAAQMPQYNAPDQQYNYAPVANPMQFIGEFANLDIKQAQADNIRAQTRKVETDREISKAVETLKQYEINDAWRSNERESARFDMWENKGGADIDWKRYVAESTEQQARAMNTGLRNTYQRELNKFIKQGITPGDSIKLRIASQILDKFNISTEWIDNFLKKVQ